MDPKAGVENYGAEAIVTSRGFEPSTLHPTESRQQCTAELEERVSLPPFRSRFMAWCLIKHEALNSFRSNTLLPIRFDLLLCWTVQAVNPI